MMYFSNQFDPDLRFVFASKCASRTTIGWMVLMREPHLLENQPDWFRSVPEKKDHAYSQIRKRIEKNEFFETEYNPNKITFCIKRDPVKRFVSAYQNMHWIGEIGNNIEKLISNWDDLLTNRPVLREHFRTQTSYYGTDAIYSHIFRHKNMKEVREFLEDYAKVHLPNIQLQQSGVKIDVKITNELIDFVKEKYAEDYANGWSD